LKCFRSDRVVNGVFKFIKEFYNNDYYAQPPHLDYEKVFNQSNEKSPIIFILSPGADPVKDVENLGTKLGFS